MTKQLLILLLTIGLCFGLSAQEWSTQYVTFDDSDNGTGYQTSSVAVVGADRFVALVTQTPTGNILANLFDPPGNYLVGYWDADSANGRVLSPINGQQAFPVYAGGNQYTDWVSGLDEVQLIGAWQIAANKQDNYVYVANNDDFRNILVFELTGFELVSTDFRMAVGKGNDNIYAIDVDDNGYVYVADYQGSDSKDDEIKVYAGIGAEGTTWGDFGGHNDAPVATIDLPEGTYLGLTVKGDGSRIYVSHSSARSLMRFNGSPESGYSQQMSFDYTMSADDTVGNGGSGTPSLLGLGYIDFVDQVYAAVDSFLHIGGTGGYPYGRVYAISGNTGIPVDTFDIAEWNLEKTGDYSSGSGDGLAGGFTSVVDVDVDQDEQAVYAQTYYGWAVEKWVYDGVLSIEQTSDAIPASYALKQNYPNPFNPITTIEFALKNTTEVQLEVFNALGQRVAVLVRDQLSPGAYEVEFDGTDAPSGVYLYRLSAGDFVSTRKMMLVK